MPKYMEQYERWLGEEALETSLKAELQDLSSKLKEAKGDETRTKKIKEEIEERFYKDLEFGTGGLRGVLGAGTNRMNIYTVGKTVQGFADYLNENTAQRSDGIPVANPKAVAIAYDSRHKSKTFAKRAADILTANGIDVYLYEDIMPTPALSFAVRYHRCSGGIMITASHNPAIYNGLKVYNADGCQESLEVSEAIIEKVEQVDGFTGVLSAKPANSEGKTGQLIYMGAEEEKAYIDAVYDQVVTEDCKTNKLTVVYTPLNGTGSKPIKAILQRIGVQKLYTVKEQDKPDGDFPTCPYPNPEKEEALELAKGLFKELKEKGKEPDIMIATDPDADRIGVAQEKAGKLTTFTGNEIGILLFDFICNHKKLPPKPMMVRTIVSTRMVDEIAATFGVKVAATLTGFKFIGAEIAKLEENGEPENYIFGFEESVGYLPGTHVRDKDAQSAAMLICQMAGYYKKRGMTLFDRLEELYEKYGYFKNDLLEFAFTGPTGMEKMAEITSRFRQEPPTDIKGRGITEITDYKTGLRRIIRGNCCGMSAGSLPTGLPSSDVLEFIFEDGNGFSMRPSGTEPKFKVYFYGRGETAAETENKVMEMKKYIEEAIK